MPWITEQVELFNLNLQHCRKGPLYVPAVSPAGDTASHDQKLILLFSVSPVRNNLQNPLLHTPCPLQETRLGPIVMQGEVSAGNGVLSLHVILGLTRDLLHKRTQKREHFKTFYKNAACC